MPEIIKTKAVVLKKNNFSDSSLIVHFYSEKFGRFSGIAKGARNKNSKLGKIIDPLNIVDIVVFNKQVNQVQLITQADLIYFPRQSFNDLEKLKYLFSALELFEKTTHENEENPPLYNALEKYIRHIDMNPNPDFYFARFFYFFIKEFGYQLPDLKCPECSNEEIQEEFFFDFNKGFLCNNCAKNFLSSFKFDKEHYEIIDCLKSRKFNQFNKEKIATIINFLEKYLMYHISEFKGLNSLRMF